MKGALVEEDVALGDWQNMGAGGMWPGRRRRVKGLKLGLSTPACCLVLLPHSTPSSTPHALILIFILQYFGSSGISLEWLEEQAWA